MAKFYIYLKCFKLLDFKSWYKFLWLKFCLIFYFLVYCNFSFSQVVIPTKGKDFWIAFPYNPHNNNNILRCDVFITSDINTNGIISIPRQGWSQFYTVIANQTTTISIPVGLAEHIGSEIIDNKGVRIVSNDTVSVFAISFQKYTADATIVYPKQSLGTEYRISSYPGYYSDFQIVATEDGTQIEITPSASTLKGKPARIPFVINLDAGESYQVISNASMNDFTGTLIKATDSSGSCRPFAVFSGTSCANVPVGCAYCDILYDQALPIATWGKTYFAVPFAFASNYTLRILADQSNTTYTINGGTPTTLNAGKFTELNNITYGLCIEADKPICVIQYMQGISCSGAGDPSMMYLNAQEQKIDHVTFSTITSTVINQHNVNVIMNTNQINQLQLDGFSVPASSFKSLGFCSSISYAQLTLTQGSHTLSADSGFTAYVYGTGFTESYAYSLGSYSKTSSIYIDSVFCTSDTVHLGTTNYLFGSWWSTISNPSDTIHIGAALVLNPPIASDIYVLHGNEFISGCSKNYYFKIINPDPIVPVISVSQTKICLNQKVQLTASTIPSNSIYDYSWTPVTGLNNPNIPNPILTATVSRWYKVAISSRIGCVTSVYDSVYIQVLPLEIPHLNVSGNQSICAGDSITLSVTNGVSFLWSPGGSTGNSISVSPSSTTNFIILINDSNGCQNSDSVLVIIKSLPRANAGQNQAICCGKSASLTASGGVSYLWFPGGSANNIIQVSPIVTSDFIVQVTGLNGCIQNDTVSVIVNPLPQASAGTDSTICSGSIAKLNASGGLTYFWTPGNYVQKSISIVLFTSTNFIVSVIDNNGCQNKDTVKINVNPLPITYAGPDTSICFGDSVTLTGTGSNYFLWTPSGSIDSTIIVSPQINSNFILTSTDSIGCFSLDTVRVKVYSLPEPNAGSNIEICFGDTITLASQTSGVGYLWSPTGSISSSINVSPDSTINYLLELTDSNGCRNTDTVQVIVHFLPIADAGFDQKICRQTSTTLIATGGSTYLWRPGFINNSTIVISPQLPIEYIVQVTDTNGCINTDTTFVDVIIPEANFNISYPICEKNILNFMNTSSNDIVDYDWDFGDGGKSSLANPTHSYSQARNYNVMLIVTDHVGCLDTLERIITLNPNPVADFETNNVCQGIESRFYNLSTIDHGKIIKWNWNFGDGFTESLQHPNHLYHQVGFYDVSLQVISDSGCATSIIKTPAIEIYPLPEAKFISSPAIVSIMDPVIQFVDQSSGGGEWVWNFGDTQGSSTLSNPTHTYRDTGVFNVHLTLINNYGCIDTSFSEIYVEPNYTFYFPNTFTPNNDNINDYFGVLGIGISEFDMYIFDRLGNEIFHSTNISSQWDGKSDGNQCSEGIYVYHTLIKDYSNKKHEIFGKINLDR